jgi:hypothetical protein
MKKSLLLTLLLVFSFMANAGGLGPTPDEINPIAPCHPSPFGTFCELQVKVKPTPKFKDYAYCGRTYVAITPRQRQVLNAYLIEQKNMVVRFKLDGEFINAPCF